MHFLVQLAGRLGRGGEASHVHILVRPNPLGIFRFYYEHAGGMHDDKQLVLENYVAMHQLLYSPMCRWHVILAHFDEHILDGCGMCDRCRDEDVPGHDIRAYLDALLIALHEIAAQVATRSLNRGAVVSMFVSSSARDITDNYSDFVC